MIPKLTPLPRLDPAKAKKRHPVEMPTPAANPYHKPNSAPPVPGPPSNTTHTANTGNGSAPAQNMLRAVPQSRTAGIPIAFLTPNRNTAPTSRNTPQPIPDPTAGRNSSQLPANPNTAAVACGQVTGSLPASQEAKNVAGAANSREADASPPSTTFNASACAHMTGMAIRDHTRISLRIPPRGIAQSSLPFLPKVIPITPAKQLPTELIPASAAGLIPARTAASPKCQAAPELTDATISHPHADAFNRCPVCRPPRSIPNPLKLIRLMKHRRYIHRPDRFGQEVDEQGDEQ